MAKVCPTAINFAIAESIHQILVLRPHPNANPTWQASKVSQGGAGGRRVQWQAKQGGEQQEVARPDGGRTCRGGRSRRSDIETGFELLFIWLTVFVSFCHL